MKGCGCGDDNGDDDDDDAGDKIIMKTVMITMI